MSGGKVYRERPISARPVTLDVIGHGGGGGGDDLAAGRGLSGRVGRRAGNAASAGEAGHGAAPSSLGSAPRAAPRAAPAGPRRLRHSPQPSRISIHNASVTARIRYIQQALSQSDA